LEDKLSKEEKPGKGGFDAAFMTYTSRVHVLRTAMRQVMPEAK